MLFAAKIALGLSATLAMSTAYVFHEGVISVDVDEHRAGGNHVHFWVPATAVNAGLYVVPHQHLREAMQQAQPFLPALREIAKELQKYPNAELVDVVNGKDYVRVAIVDGKIQIDAVDHDQTVHVRVPVETFEDVSDRLEADAPTI
jgi:hypothetical protein